MFTKRTTKPKGNKYYIRQVNGGYNAAIQGNPTDPNANVLSNCVGYANGRFNEIGGYGACKYQIHCNAENFIERAKQLGLKISSKPVLGGIMCWQYGSLSGSDGAGHVEIVEEIIDSNTIYTSASNWGGTAFYNATRKNSNGRWGLGSGFVFRGCIVNPAVKEEPKPTAKTVTATGKAHSFSNTYAKTYYATAALNCRNSGSINAKILTTVPKGTKVQCYGYYEKGTNRNWLYAIAVVGGVQYTGFFASDYLSTSKNGTITKTLGVGSRIRIASGAPIYGTNRLFAAKVYQNVYTVTEIYGDRVVFNSGKIVMGAVAKKYCIVQ